MFKSLYSKLAAVLAVLFCMVAMIFVAVAIFATNRYQQEVNQRLNRHLAKNVVSGNTLIESQKVNTTALKEIFNMLMVINPGIEVYLLDIEGKILSFSAPEGRVKRKQIGLAPIKRWISQDSRLPILGDDPRNFDGKKVFSAARIPEQGDLQGYLYVILGGESYDSVVKGLQGSYILKLSAWIIFASMLFAFIAGLLLFALMTRRLRHLSNAVNNFKTNETKDGNELTLKRGSILEDEIDRLGITFKEMAERIEKQIKQLKESDALRRELIANVSHDLRTPLANLRGYIETLILKENRLSQKERHNYLDIAVKHCERLGRLVDSLLELAKFESLEIKLNPETFNLPELVSDVIQKFRLKAKEKAIDMEIAIDRDIPFVHADIGMIERVMENLIENAISHTPPEGRIFVGFLIDGNSVLVQVGDTGAGIPQEDIPHIFDRFFQSKRNKETDPEHTGLGLAIAKRILDLHASTIKVLSSPESGTAFNFSLPVYKDVES